MSTAEGVSLTRTCYQVPMIECLCIIEKDNFPALLRVYSGGKDLNKYHYMCYCAIDIFEEKEHAVRAGGVSKQVDSYLGTLYPAQEHKIHGYITNTGVRMVMILDEKDGKDGSLVKAFFKKLHSLHAECVSNPFHRDGQPIVSKKLDRDLEALVRLWNSDAFSLR